MRGRHQIEKSGYNRIGYIFLDFDPQYFILFNIPFFLPLIIRQEGFLVNKKCTFIKNDWGLFELITHFDVFFNLLG